MVLPHLLQLATLKDVVVKASILTGELMPVYQIIYRLLDRDSGAMAQTKKQEGI